MKKLEVYIENLHNGKNAWIELPTSDIVINKVLEEINPFFKNIFTLQHQYKNFFRQGLF